MLPQCTTTRFLNGRILLHAGHSLNFVDYIACLYTYTPVHCAATVFHILVVYLWTYYFLLNSIMFYIILNVFNIL